MSKTPVHLPNSEPHVAGCCPNMSTCLAYPLLSPGATASISFASRTAMSVAIFHNSYATRDNALLHHTTRPPYPEHLAQQPI